MKNTVSTLCLRDSKFYAKVVIFFNIFSVEPYFKAMTSELFLICLVVSKRDKMNKLAEVCLVGLGVGGKLHRLVAISIGL